MSDKEYFWGPATSTIDWCEENYHVSPYLAEFFNTTTNLMFMFLSLFGIYNTIKNGFSSSFIIAYLGVMFVGFGSWCFHMTLQYEMQLLDELPMIYVASIMVWHIFKADPNHKKNYKLPLILAIYSAIITYSYLIIKNPVFHQVSYALLVFTIVFKSISLQLTVPSVNYEKSKLEKLLWFSALGFIVAFIVWNIDNQFCTYLRAWRHSVSFIMGSFSELHGWWHIGTGIKKSLSCKPNSNISKRSEPTTLSSIVNGSSKY
ncbi:hypothetical protein G6F47_003131 [Rhizopus delemar]|uniref:Alkaline ceramidase 3 n=1 Tax=Rhizopus oryzae TaxID=64495 RepID=A0A9P6YKM4_RHIOR|nr:hypothetical protein G6F51_002119 [Rhizopus arrhizus]KAG1602038.1 hypothetical protein G6F47_003131 [Rhizopus delemar]